MSKVSIVVATYRRTSELKRALASLAMQTYSHTEIIVVDDNAEKKYNEYVKSAVDEFKEKYPRANITLIQNEENMGSAETRNIGIRVSDGEYITFLDDDDEYLPEKVERQLSFMKDGDFDYSITDLDLYNEKGKLVRQRKRNFIKEYSKEALLNYHLMNHLTGTDSMMFKKEYLEKIKGFAPINVGDEFYLMLRAIDNGGKFGYLPECYIKAYIHSGEEGLSGGDSKIAGETDLYKYKEQFFGMLDKKTVRYIKMRHYAVLAFAEIKRRNILKTAMYSFKSFKSAPLQFFRFFFGKNF